ncbi:MAG: GDP-mannose 4,6-dehydratase [Candidatus Bathyarchaeota archaeon]
MVFEDGKQTRDFIFVEDVATANLQGVKSNKTGVYNVGTGKSNSVLGIAENLIDMHDSKVKPKITNEFRAGDNRHDFADISKIKKDLNFKPKWSLKTGLQKLLEWSEEKDAVDMFEIAEKQRKKYFD